MRVFHGLQGIASSLINRAVAATREVKALGRCPELNIAPDTQRISSEGPLRQQHGGETWMVGKVCTETGGAAGAASESRPQDFSVFLLSHYSIRLPLTLVFQIYSPL